MEGVERRPKRQRPLPPPWSIEELAAMSDTRPMTAEQAATLKRLAKDSVVLAKSGAWGNHNVGPRYTTLPERDPCGDIFDPTLTEGSECGSL
jgi:hypothetical protein